MGEIRGDTVKSAAGYPCIGHVAEVKDFSRSVYGMRQASYKCLSSSVKV